MKKILSIIMAALTLFSCVFAFASCGKEEKLVCGVTIIKNMNELDKDGNWTGFETEFAEAVAEKLGMKAEFVKISWEQKYNELNSGAIDCIWNGFTANSEDNGKKRSEYVDFSYGYMLNQQCIVVKKDKLAEITSEQDLADKSACVEGGSAGASYAESVTDKNNVVSATSQMDTFAEVKSGAVDFAVVDMLLAKNICGEGNYEDLAIVEAIQLDFEIYAVGFKKGSELTAKVNAAIKELEADGTLMELAKKYGFENVLKVTETIE